MKETLRLLASFETVAPATEEAVSAAQAQLGVRLPVDYVEFLYCSNGGEGIIGETYLMLWQVEDLAKLNIARIIGDRPLLFLLLSQFTNLTL
jgi:cell wall assembly regulator SMI1